MAGIFVNRPALRNSAALVAAVLLCGWLSQHGATQEQKAAPAPAALPAVSANDNAHRWVAVIYGNIPITREELGEYLIARQGAERLELLVNKRIIEHACQLKGIEVTDAEVEGALAEDLKGMKVSLDVFVNRLLKEYKKTLLEWKEDVIRPKLAMTKLCQDRVQITDKDYQDAFEAYYGEKVDCRIILFPKGEERQAMQSYGEIRKSDENFDRYAKQQASPSLAATGGRIRPIARHTTGNDELEKEAFSLQPGEISRLLGTPEGEVILKCARRIPADTTKKLENEREALRKEIVEKKTQAEMPKLFKELHDQAQVKLFLKKQMTQEELERDVQQELKRVNFKPGEKTPAGK
jgi:parvulin-like peptidyl-prolyl isomerase